MMQILKFKMTQLELNDLAWDFELTKKALKLTSKLNEKNLLEKWAKVFYSQSWENVFLLYFWRSD